eukprot:14861110-Alexandrium_andersonii.AAC.1
MAIVLRAVDAQCHFRALRCVVSPRFGRIADPSSADTCVARARIVGLSFARGPLSVPLRGRRA